MAATFLEQLETMALGALGLLLPAAVLAGKAYLQKRAREWEAKDAYTRATELGARMDSSVPPQRLEDWAVTALMQRKPALSEDEARELVRKVTPSTSLPIPAADRPTMPEAGPSTPGPGSS